MKGLRTHPLLNPTDVEGSIGQADTPAVQPDAPQPAPPARVVTPHPQKPSIGRIVHYTPPGATAATKEGQPYPAIITHINTDGTVNLLVFNDGRNRLNSTGIPTNVEEYVPGPEAPPEGGFWFWPSRV